MNIQTEVKHSASLTEDEKTVLRQLHMGNGYLWKDFNDYKKASKSKVILARMGASIMGWGFVYEADKKFYYQLYVKKGYRGKGIGDEIKRATKNIFVGEKATLVLGSHTMKMDQL